MSEFGHQPKAEFDPQLLASIAADTAMDHPEGYCNAGWWTESIVRANDLDDLDFVAQLDEGRARLPQNDRAGILLGLLEDGIDVLADRDLVSADFPKMLGLYVERELAYGDALQLASGILVARSLESDEDKDNPAKIALEYAQQFQGVAKVIRQYDNDAILSDGWANIRFPRSSWCEAITDSIGNLHLLTHEYVMEDRVAFLKILETLELPTEAERQALTLEYGAKAANLLVIDRLFKHITDRLESTVRRTEFKNILVVPPFITIPTSRYEDWQRTGSLDDAAQQVKTFLLDHTQPCIIRSSAVYSEDGEHMGAGVYESVTLPANPTDAEITAAISRVYRSVDHPTAQAYRRQVGITEAEKMGLVVQEMAFPDTGYSPGFANSQASHNRRLAEFTLVKPDGALYFSLRRAGVLAEIGIDSFADGEEKAPRFFVPPDINRLNVHTTWEISQLLAFSELILGKTVQIEFAVAEREGARLLQARPLASDWLNEAPFAGFPTDRTPNHRGRSAHVMNGTEATVLNRFKPEPVQEPTLYVFDSSFSASNLVEKLRLSLGNLTEADKQNMHVLIIQPPGGQGNTGFGHLETLFTELKIPLIFTTEYQEEHDIFHDGTHVELYADGNTAQIYLKK